MIVHDVFFTLHDNSASARQTLIDAGQKYLTDHSGVTFYAMGVLTESLARPVHDRAWDVGLHVVFQDLAAHDAYQIAPRHKQFIEACKANWQQVRVFDTETA